MFNTLSYYISIISNRNVIIICLHLIIKMILSIKVIHIIISIISNLAYLNLEKGL